MTEKNHYIYIGPWELLPWWHPARLLGYDLRRRIENYNFHIGDQYGRSKRVAREMLREFRKTVKPFLGDTCVMVPAFGMWLGIEQDGYTHS